MSITNLPADLIENISSFLPINDSIGSLPIVNKQLRDICSSNSSKEDIAPSWAVTHIQFPRAMTIKRYSGLRARFPGSRQDFTRARRLYNLLRGTETLGALKDHIPYNPEALTRNESIANRVEEHIEMLSPRDKLFLLQFNKSLKILAVTNAMNTMLPALLRGRISIGIMLGMRKVGYSLALDSWRSFMSLLSFRLFDSIGPQDEHGYDLLYINFGFIIFSLINIWSSTLTKDRYQMIGKLAASAYLLNTLYRTRKNFDPAKNLKESSRFHLDLVRYVYKSTDLFLKITKKLEQH